MCHPDINGRVILPACVLVRWAGVQKKVELFWTSRESLLNIGWAAAVTFTEYIMNKIKEEGSRR